MRVRDILAWLGIAVGLVGLGFAFAPSVGAAIDLSAIMVQFVGIAAVGLAILGYLARRRREMSRAEPPIVESMPDLVRPGTDADDGLSTASGFSLPGHTKREELGDRIYALAIEVLVVTDGCSEREAAEMLREGTWTDDPRAQAMFGTDPPSTSTRDVLAGIFTGRSQFVVQATHAIEAIRRRLESGSEGAERDREAEPDQMEAEQ